MIYEIEGIVYHIGETWSNETGTFSKIPLILLVTEFYNDKKYENFIEFDFIGEAQHLTAPVDPGNKVVIRFVLQGRLGKGQYEGRAFTTLKAIKIDVLEATTPQQAQQNVKAGEVESNVNEFVDESGDDNAGADDLPF